MNELIIALKKNIVAQAKYYLENADEFFPFGCIINTNNEIKPISILTEEENPEAIVIFNRLENALIEGIKKKKYLIGAIAVDVYINKTNPALEIKIYKQDLSILIFYFLYSKQDNTYLFKETKL